MTTDFDKYVDNYKEIINKVSSASGEEFEYFIKLRIALMKAKIYPKTSYPLKILDFGCGIGATEAFLKDSFPKAKIFGIDTSEKSIETARKQQSEDIVFLVVKSAILPFEDNYFDLIYSNGTFHHIDHEKHIMILKELLRILKKGGDIFIFENNPYNPLMMRAMKNNPFDKDARVVYPAYLKNILKDVGFKFNALNYYFFYPRWLRFLRFSEKYLWWLPIGAQYFVWESKH